MSIVTENAKSIMNKKGLKQKYLAQKMKISERQLSNIFCGRKTIDENIITKLYNALDISPNELFSYERK